MARTSQSLTRVRGMRGMRGVGDLPRRGPAFSVVLLSGLLLSSCKTVEGGPDRLYTVPEEVAQARAMLDVAAPDGIPGLATRYYAVIASDSNADAQRMYLRNEIIARRMYIIDVEYSEYEASLTSERQKFGFLTTAAASALGIAATLTTPVRSAQIVAGSGAAMLAARGAYDSEVVIAKTLQIVQGYMRASRDDVASRQILPRLTESTVTYPLSAALHSLEDYYRAGTFTAGLIPALRDSGTAADQAAAAKAMVLRGSFQSDNATAVLDRYLHNLPGGKLNTARLKRINDCLVRFQAAPANILVHMQTSGSAAVRQLGVRCAQDDPGFTG
jgi:hypothetical protein